MRTARFHGSGNGRRQPDALADVGRLTPHDHHPSDVASELRDHPEHGMRVHPVGVERLGVGTFRVGFQQAYGAGRVAGRHRVHEHQKVSAFEEIEREMQASNAVIDDGHVGGKRTCEKVANDLASEAVVTVEDVPDPRDERLHSGSTSSGWKYM